jgi:SPP1 gp7 family putative phage head morphogenesis protein
LEWREEYGRGGTAVGVARARDLVNRKNLSPDTVARMVSYFARHEVDKEATGFREGEEGFPSAGKIAWQLWGGDAGKAWSEKKWSQIKDEDEEKSIDVRQTTAPRSEQRTALWRKMVQGRSKIEKAYLSKFTRLLAEARREQIAKINANASLFGQSNKVLSPQLVFSLDPWKNKVTKEFRKVNIEALNDSTREVNEEIERIKPPTPAAPNAPKADPWKLPPSKAISFLDQRENLLKGIADDIHKEIMSIIELGMTDRLGSEAIAEKIREKFNQISNGRAKTIARTETGAAYGYSREEAMKAAGIGFKEWLATQDDRCRATHLAADGQIVPMDQPFDVGGAALMYPCDPDGPPEEIINCRCVQVAVDRP